MVVSVSPTRSLVTSLIPVIRNPTSPACSASAEVICGREEPDVVDLGLGARLHRPDRLALGEGPVDDADIGDHTPVLVELRVEDQRPWWLVGITGRRRNARDQLVENIGHTLAGLRADPAHGVGGLAEQLGYLAGHPLRLRAGQIDLVQARDQFQAGLHREIGVGHGLSLDALRGVHDEERALARRQRARDLVGEVNVARGVDQMQLIGLAVPPGLIEDADGLSLDRDPALSLEVHRIEHLRPHRARIDGVGQLEDPVGQRRFAVIDVGDDREVADVRLVGH